MKEPVRIVVVCEALADQRTAGTLTDRMLCARSSWFDQSTLETARQWFGLSLTSKFIAWKDVRREAERLSIRVHGHFDGRPGTLDARAARRALMVVAQAVPDAPAVILVRDSDNRLERKDGLCQARDSAKWQFQIVVGVAHTKRECWLLAAFQPADDVEVERLRKLRGELGFNPCSRSERLTAHQDQAKRSAKRVLQFLCGEDELIQERGIAETPLDILIANGERNGLREFLSEVECRLVPLLG